ncbi:DUF6520 family protein, partial [Zobellia galactanivorans]|uniref:DUF6520 family protein n=2 Tax=Zobellia TaxID=112040 RepID=UPI001C06C559
LMAVGLSFAFEANSIAQSGYYNNPLMPGIQQVPGGVDCPETGKKACTYDGYQVYADQALSIPLFERP